MIYFHTTVCWRHRHCTLPSLSWFPAWDRFTHLVQQTAWAGYPKLNLLTYWVLFHSLLWPPKHISKPIYSMFWLSVTTDQHVVCCLSYIHNITWHFCAAPLRCSSSIILFLLETSDILDIVKIFPWNKFTLIRWTILLSHDLYFKHFMNCSFSNSGNSTFCNLMPPIGYC